jgi:probable phosphoglycerate mutase
MPDTQSLPVTLFLVRHGQAVPDSEGIYDNEAELTELGRKQAGAVATALQSSKINALYTSPLRRATQTADAIAQRLALKPVFDARLVEIEVSRQVVSQILAGAIFPFWQGHHRAYHNGETLADFSKRIGAFFRDIVERHEGHAVAVVSHGGVTNQLLRWALGFTAESDWRFHFEIFNGSITEVVFWLRGARNDHAPWYSTIKRVGDTSHLGGFASHF